MIIDTYPTEKGTYITGQEAQRTQTVFEGEGIPISPHTFTTNIFRTQKPSTAELQAKYPTFAWNGEERRAEIRESTRLEGTLAYQIARGFGAALAGAVIETGTGLINEAFEGSVYDTKPRS